MKASHVIFVGINPAEYSLYVKVQINGRCVAVIVINRDAIIYYFSLTLNKNRKLCIGFTVDTAKKY